MSRDVVHYLVPPGPFGFQGQGRGPPLALTQAVLLPGHHGLTCHWGYSSRPGGYIDHAWSGAELQFQLWAGATQVGRAEATVFRFPPGTSGGKMFDDFDAESADLASLGGALKAKTSWARRARTAPMLYLQEIEILSDRRGAGLGEAFLRVILCVGQTRFAARQVILLAWPFAYSATVSECAAEVTPGAVIVADREVARAHERLHRFYRRVLGVRPVRIAGDHWFCAPISRDLHIEGRVAA